MSRAGSTRQALDRLIDAGMTGTYKALAAAAGVPAHTARATLKELSRCGLASAGARTRRSSPAVYGRPPAHVDVLAFTRQAWR